MSLYEKFQYLGAFIDAVSLLTLALPIAFAMRTQGPISRKALFVAATFAAAWVFSAGLFAAAVLPSVWGRVLLARTINATLDPSKVLLLVHNFAESTSWYWYFAVQIVVPVIAAVSAFPLSVLLARRLIKQPVPLKNAA